MAVDVNSSNNPEGNQYIVNDDLRDAPYTRNLLSHAHPEHLHQTTARLFIGPLPQGWVKTHKRNWYGTKKKYTSRAITFTAQQGTLTQRNLSGIETGRADAVRETLSQTSEQIISQPISTVSTSQQFTSDSGTAPSTTSPATARRDSNLDRVLESSPVVRFLSPAARRADEEELRRLEADRAARKLEEDEVVDLEPLPSKDDGSEEAGQRGSAVEMARSLSEEPLLQDTHGVGGSARISTGDSIDA